MSPKDTKLNPFGRKSPHWRLNETTFPNVQKPKVISGFSIVDGENGENEFVDSLENIRYLHLPEGEISWDLNEGFENYKEKPPETAGITFMLDFIRNHHEKLVLPHMTLSGKVLRADFVCFRSLLTEVMCTPYEPRKIFRPWTIAVTKYRGTFYMKIVTKEKEECQEEEKDAEKTERKKRAGYYGYKFQQMMTTKELNTPPDPSDPVPGKTFCVTFQSCFGYRHQMLYSGGIHAIQTDTAVKETADLLGTSLKFLDFHTKMANMEGYKFAQFKLRNWWCKNFTAGVETVYVGSRTAEGILEKTEAMKVEEMPEMSKSVWCASVCMGFLIDFLTLVKNHMEDIDNPETVAWFSFDPALSYFVQFEIFPEKTEKSLLPDWYVDFIENLCSVGGNVPEGEEEEPQEAGSELPDKVSPPEEEENEFL